MTFRGSEFVFTTDGIADDYFWVDKACFALNLIVARGSNSADHQRQAVFKCSYGNRTREIIFLRGKGGGQVFAKERA